MNTATSIRDANEKDGSSLAVIYNHYIRETVVTFEETEIDGEEMASRLAEIQDSGLPWLVLEEAGEVRGYCYASKWKGRCAYRYSVEITVYLADGAGGRGYGSQLYAALFERLRAEGYHVALAGIALPNDASIALHERFGMTRAALFKEVGYKFDRWVDVGYWHCRLGDPD